MAMSLLALALAAAQAPSAAPQHLHPDGVEFVMVLPGIQPVLDVFGNTALARTLADEELHEVLGDVMGGGPMDLVDLLAQRWRDLGGPVPPILDLHEGFRSVSFSVDPGADGGFSLSSLAQVVEGATSASDLKVRLVIDFQDEASGEAVARLLDASLRGVQADDLPTRAVSLAGDGGAFGSPRLTVVEFPDLGDDVKGHLVHGGTRAVMAIGVDDIDEEILRLSHAAPDAFSSEIEAGRAKLGAAEGTTLMEVYIPPYAGLSAVMEAADGPEAMMFAGPIATMMEMMFGAPGTAMYRGGHWRVQVRGDGRYLTKGWIPGSPPLASLQMIGGAVLDPSSLTLAHPDALVTSVASFEPKQLLDLLVQLPQAANGEDLEQVMVDMDTRFGFRLDRDLIEPLGGSISYSLPKLRSLLSAPNLMAVATLDDREAFTRGMDGLMAMMKEAGRLDSQRTEYRGATLYTLSLDAFTGGDGGMQSLALPLDPSTISRPTLTVMEDRVLLSTLPSHAKREVRRVAKLTKAGEGAELHAGLSAVEIPGAATMVSSANWPVFYGNLYTQLRALAPVILSLAEDGYDAAGVDTDLPLPFKLDSLPEMDLLTRHFAPSERSWVKVEGGLVDTSVSSLGPELPMLLLGASFYLSIMVTEQALLTDDVEFGPNEEAGLEDVEVVAEVSSGAEMATKTQLVSLGVAIQVYRLDHSNAFPASLVELTKREGGQPPYLSGALEDGWGRAVRYRVTEEGCRLWSLGPDGVDQEGEGDDLLHVVAR